MDGSQRLQSERVTHHGEIPGLPDGRWLVPFLLLYVRNGDTNVYELAERLSDLGFGVGTPAELHQTLRKMEKNGLLEKDAIVPNGNLPGYGATRERYDLTVAGEAYLDFWGDSLEQYREELSLFLHLYKGGRDAHTSPATASTDSGRDGRDGAGTVFVLTSSGLRHMGLRPGSARPHATGSGFLGYLQEEIFWKDALELVHEDDLPLLRFLVSLVMEEPGASESVEVRFRDARGDWVLMDVCVLNVLEAPTGDDTGLLVVNVRQTRESTSWRDEMPNGNQQAPR
ncbi:MAG: transcriptional regulator, PadR family [Rubrobacteraceae bacterium]|jgi:PadR family transcriptional regulator PadR|nr:transcriptional regulator, PadR family [Rubrobacteraceae bacterium]